MRELHELSAKKIVSLIKKKELRPLEVMESFIGLSDKLDHKLRVWETFDPEVAKSNAKLSEKLIGQDLDRYPLLGVPIGIKDIIYTKDQLTTFGSKIYSRFKPEYDASVVSLLKQAGGVIMGKTVTTEFAYMDPPPTLNPWDFQCTPGGSSSGSAVGVASGLFPVALGTQTAGSVVRPASYNGVVGFKPTFGIISRYGIMPFAWSLDTAGIFGRWVDDIIIVFDELARYDKRDSSSVEITSPGEICKRKPKTIGIIPELISMSDDETRKNFFKLINNFENDGISINEIDTGVKFEDLLHAHKTVMSSEVASLHQGMFKSQYGNYGKNIRNLIETGMITPSIHYIKSQRLRSKFVFSIKNQFAEVDAIITPTTPKPAPRDLNGTGDPAFQIPWTTGGFPSITIPTFISKDRLPIGTQIISNQFDDWLLLSYSKWFQEEYGDNTRPF